MRRATCVLMASLNFLSRFSYAVSLRSVSRGLNTHYVRSSVTSQYESIKEQYPDHILLFQVGDFYEIFGKDAELVSSKTTLQTCYRKNILLAGFPVRALSEWLKTLLKVGFKLAICNQTANRVKNGTILDREIVQLITPGTLLDPEGAAANHLLSIVPGPEENLGLAWLELSTSNFQVTMINETQLDEHIERISPSEVLLTQQLLQLLQKGSFSGHISSPVKALQTSAILKECQVTPISQDWLKEKTTPPETYRDILAVLGKDGYSSLEQQASLAILNYIGHTQRSFVPFLRPPSRYSHDSHMTIDTRTRRSLELVTPLLLNTKSQTLLGCIDKAVTAGGKRLIKERLSAPLTNVEDINRRLNLVAYFYKNIWESHWLTDSLKSISDLERLLQKVATGTASMQDLVSISNTLITTGSIACYFNDDLLTQPDLDEELRGLQEFSELTNELSSAICKETLNIKEGYSNEIDGLQQKLRENEAKVQHIATSLMQQFNISKLVIVQHKHFYRVLETTQAQAKKIGDALRRVDKTQSVARFTTTELQDLNSEHQRLSIEYESAQSNVQKQLMEKIKENTSELLLAAKGLAAIDVSLGLSCLARDNDYCRPVLLPKDSMVFDIKDGYHPVLSSITAAQTIPNDCNMEEHKTWIITGPNMGGKSTFLRQNALIAILAQIGSYVPAKSAVIGVVDKVFARVGASDNLTKGLSTFYTEMIETSHIIGTAMPSSFVVLDEIGRGTATREGVAIAQAVLEHIHQKIGCRTLLATHFHKLTQNADPGIGCYRVVAQCNENGEMLLTYKIELGSTNSSYALQTAKLAGLPLTVTERAKSLMSEGTED